MNPVSPSSHPGFVSFNNTDGEIELIDLIERKRCHFRINSDGEKTPIGSNHFTFPVDKGISFQTETIEAMDAMMVYVRDGDGQHVAEVSHNQSKAFEKDCYTLELSGPIKSYIEVESACEVSHESDSIRISFPSISHVRLGARSKHRHPAGTIYTTENTTDLMAAVSSFGSALKTLSPERSFPTLRGHPPKLEFADEFNLPDGFEPPAEHVTVSTRETLKDIFTVAPLSFYLGAEIVPDTTSQILVDNEVVYDLEAGNSLEQSVEQVLPHIFLMDCITRTEGFYPVDLAERSELAEWIPFDLEYLYDTDHAERISAYLDIPHESLSDLLPEWPLIAHVEDSHRSAPMLPHVIDRLGLVNVHSTKTEGRLSDKKSNQFNVNQGESHPFATVTPSISAEKHTLSEHLWVGPGIVPSCTKALESGYRHGLSRELSEDDISVTIICNDDTFTHESDILQNIYTSRDDRDIEVTIHDPLSTGELAELLSDQTDFLHYIGHVEPDGFVCTDGYLGPSDIGEVGVSTFLLNACRSYQIGQELVRKGAIGGIVTFTDVIDDGAAWMGITLGKLLNHGYPLNAALSTILPETLLGEQYLVIGNGRVSITQSESVPSAAEISLSDEPQLSYIALPSDSFDIGTIVIPNLPGITEYHLNSKIFTPKDGSLEEILEFISKQQMPVRIDGELHWSKDVDFDELVTRH